MTVFSFRIEFEILIANRFWHCSCENARRLQMEEKNAAIQLHRQRVGEEEQRDRRPIGAACFAALFMLDCGECFHGSRIYVSVSNLSRR